MTRLGPSSLRTSAVCAALLLAAACAGHEAPPPPAPAAPSPVQEPAPPSAPAAPEGLLVADFEAAARVNNLGGEFGMWASSGDAPAAKMAETLAPGEGVGGGGAWRLDYDITTPGSYCGIWMRLNNLDVSNSRGLAFQVKGVGEFSRSFIVELKTAPDKAHRANVTGVGADWTTVRIPLSAFEGLDTKKPLYELTVVYDEGSTPVRKGTYLVDNIVFE